jgi:hypothetical protein
VAEKDGDVRLHIAFESGQAISVNVSAADVEGFEKALAGDDRVFELASDDGTYVVALARVVYVRKSEREATIGFGA